MPRNVDRGKGNDEDRVQDVVVPKVQLKGGSLSEGQNKLRYLNTRALLSHYAHVRGGVKAVAKCGFCRNGMEGVSEDVAPVAPKPDVVPDSGVDKERPTTPSSGTWWDRRS